MNDKFDKLAKGLAQCVTRRGAMKTFGIGVAGIAMAALGVTNKVEAGTCQPSGSPCHPHDSKKCCSGLCAFGDIVDGKSFYLCV
jgi:hypothetical protein